MTRHRRRRLKLRSLYVWHRWLGVAAALWVVVLSLTGIALNHTEELALDATPVEWSWLQDAYGIRSPVEVPAFRAGGRWVSQWGDRIYLDARPAGRLGGPLRGALEVDGIIAAAGDNEILLLTPAGERVELLGPAHGVPAGIAALGRGPGGRPVVRAAHGLYVSDREFTAWRHLDAGAVRWSDPAPLPAALHEAIAPAYRAGLLSAERVLLDLHSGRLLGRAGVWLSDAAAVILVVLALSGTFLWSRQIRRRRAGDRRQRTEDRSP